MKLSSLVAAASALGLLAAPASATLMFSADINGTTITCTDNQGPSASCPGGDTNPAVGTLQVANQTIAGVTFNGSSQISQIGPPTNALNSSSFQFSNGNSTTVSLQLAVGDTSYAGPVANFSATGSGSFQSTTGSDAVGSSVLMQYFADAANAQPAMNPTDLPGTALASPADMLSVTLPTESFSFNHSGPFAANAPFSMALETTIQLTPGADVVGRNQAIITEVAIPEPASTLGFIGIMLIVFGALHRHTVRRAREAAHRMWLVNKPSFEAS